jgi:UDPglucose 6-dehydrogenase
MRVGIVGLGVVGSAVADGLEDLGHTIIKHDIRLGTSLEIIEGTEICFICVPTPSSKDGSCDTSIVSEVVGGLVQNGYDGVICIKSTVSPGTTRSLQNYFSYKKICFVPEFLKERSAKEDFTSNHDLCIIGTTSESVYELVRECHGPYPKIFKMLTETEAEFCKYFNNAYNATLITFANSFYQICKEKGVDYTNVKGAMVLRDHINDVYLGCSEALRGFGGMCLPKDTKALATLCEDLNLNVDFFKMILKENSKYKVTVFGGMRKE